MKPFFLFLYLTLGLISLGFAGNNIQSSTTAPIQQAVIYGPNPPQAQRFFTFSEFLKEKLLKPGKGKKWETALILCIISFFTIHGLHRFYLGYIGVGLAQMFLSILCYSLCAMMLYLFLFAVSSGILLYLPFMLSSLGLLIGLAALIWWLFDLMRISKRNLLPKIEEYVE